jgi:hypothetical protein
MDEYMSNARTIYVVVFVALTTVIEVILHLSFLSLQNDAFWETFLSNEFDFYPNSYSTTAVEASAISAI